MNNIYNMDLQESEINEDNCVLDEFELCYIKAGFDVYNKQGCLPERVKIDLNKLFLKIVKLNDLAKKEQDE